MYDLHPRLLTTARALVVGVVVALLPAQAGARDRNDTDDEHRGVEAIDPSAVVPARVLVDTDELEALEARLTRAVFRAEAQHGLPEPYQQETPLSYDGAVVAVRTPEGRLGFLTTATWLEQAETVRLIDPEGHGDDGLELTIERVDARVDLALLRADDLDIDAEHFEPLELATQTPMVTWALLSPQTAWAQLTSMSLLPSETEQLEGGATSIYWPSTLSAINGYPAVDADGRIVALHARRALDTQRGLAVGWPMITTFLDPDAETRDGGRDLARPRAPDRVLESPLLDRIRNRTRDKSQATTSDDDDDTPEAVEHTDDDDDAGNAATPHRTRGRTDRRPFRYRFGGNGGQAIEFGRR